MKRFSNPLLLFLLSLVPSLGFTQDASLEMGTPLVCNLTEENLAKRKVELGKLIFSKLISTEKVEDGYIFQFQDEPSLLRDLLHYIGAERACCPFFTFDLHLEAEGKGIELTISGPKPAQEMLGQFVEQLKK